MIHTEVKPLFPTPILMSMLGRDITNEERKVLEDNYKPDMVRNNDGNISSLNRYILKDNLPEIRKEIESQIDYYLKNIIDPVNDVKLYITQSWLNYTQQGQFHHEHAHPNSIISGVFYFNAVKEHDKIWFYKNQFRDIKILPNWNHYNAESWWFEVETGMLVMFPSYLRHKVPITTGDHTRISLAFNTFATGIIGQEEELYSLHLPPPVSY
jgi:uncharacterized protein (TIGR02466 family)